MRKQQNTLDLEHERLNRWYSFTLMHNAEDTEQWLPSWHPSNPRMGSQDEMNWLPYCCICKSVKMYKGCWKVLYCFWAFFMCVCVTVLLYLQVYIKMYGDCSEMSRMDLTLFEWMSRLAIWLVFIIFKEVPLWLFVFIPEFLSKNLW